MWNHNYTHCQLCTVYNIIVLTMNNENNASLQDRVLRQSGTCSTTCLHSNTLDELKIHIKDAWDLTDKDHFPNGKSDLM